ncbi:hypothetical protein B0T25DRAFT_316348 [Lasiosphaeria hispida]|uniref:Uncharacterized protein n=1 Tax=Lasiosphaeria hispida TaxID=260671 RepID=A0AAJ0M9P7_9PEZI|nr:hypothetical protein B0T25DRAFT_316348 [Lasiosphaeria hispida]
MQRGVSRPPRRGCAAQHTRPCTIGVLCRVIQVFDYAFCVVAVKSQRVTCLVASVCGFGFVSAVLRSVQTFDFKTRGTLELAKLPCHCADATPKMACLESRLTALNFRLAKAKDVHSRGVCRQTNLDRPSRKKNARRAIRRQTADAASSEPHLIPRLMCAEHQGQAHQPQRGADGTRQTVMFQEQLYSRIRKGCLRLGVIRC